MTAVLDEAADAALLEVLLTPEGRADPYPLYRLIRERAPVLHTSLPDGSIALTRYEDCIVALRNPHLGRGIVGPNARPARSALPGAADPEVRAQFFRRAGESMLFTDPPEHTRLRGLVSRAFTPKRVEALRPAVEAMVAALLDEMAERAEVDVMDVLAFPLPVAVIGELVGVPGPDRAQFRSLVRASTAGLEPFVDNDAILTAVDAQQQMRSYFFDLLEERRRSAHDDLLSVMLETSESDDRLTDDEIVSTAILLFGAGFETTTNLIGNGLSALMANPTQFDRLRADPDLTASAVDELLRYDSPVQMNSRTALEPADVAGVALEQGQTVMVLQGAANRDPARFDDPDRLDLGRRGNAPLSFGWGAHHCIGAALARMEGAVVFRALADRFSSIEPTGEPVERRPGITLRGVVNLPVSLSPR
ncbi:MAG TPA: cytochrome P450 [Acidimicrobiales bacterium]|nr:cytochrome P450 [Acidimicrobiales bacterium]